MKIFKTRWFARFARQEKIADDGLREAIERAERGLVDADLGGGLIKQRVARQGQADPAAIASLLPTGQRTGPFSCLALPKTNGRILARMN